MRSPSNPSHQVAEIVTFRLNPGVSQVDFIAAAEQTGPLLRASGQVMSRALSCDNDGLWTDHITWVSMQAAQDTAASILKDPAFAPFLSMIAPQDMSMRHAPILMQMD